jgi:2-phospho-L-lactate guanylyltransferase
MESCFGLADVQSDGWLRNRAETARLVLGAAPWSEESRRWRNVLSAVRTRIIIPHRGLETAKMRLAPVLSPSERRVLAQRLLTRVLAVTRECCQDVVVISPSASLASVVESAGAELVIQRCMGLNADLDQARDAADHDGVELLVIVHGDLPNLRTADVRALIAGVPRPRGVAVGPNRVGTGTNALALRPPTAIDFAFGFDSFVAHVTSATEAGLPVKVVRKPGLAFDLDTPEDLACWRESGGAG